MNRCTGSDISTTIKRRARSLGGTTVLDGLYSTFSCLTEPVAYSRSTLEKDFSDCVVITIPRGNGTERVTDWGSIDLRTPRYLRTDSFGMNSRSSVPITNLFAH